jgi:type IV pilus assembly protein PilC
LTTFAYIVLDPAGKEQKGSLQAENRDAAAAQLRSDGKTLVSLTEAGALSREVEISIFQRKPKARDMAVFCRQFVSIISAGVTVIEALDMLAEQTENRLLAAALAECRMSIEKGSSLADAMRAHRSIFSDLFITMVAAGEASGSLDVSFSRMAVQFEKDAKLRGTVKRASIYPIIICVITVIVVVILLTFVIPSFEGMFADLDQDLPAVTRAVMGASPTFADQVVFHPRGDPAAGLRHPPGQAHLRRGPLLRPPGPQGAPVRQPHHQDRRGPDVPDPLHAAGRGHPADRSHRHRLRHHGQHLLPGGAGEAKDDVAMGAPLSETLERSGIFPALVYHMLRIGEESGDIEGMLNKLADYYDEESSWPRARSWPPSSP